MHVHLRHEFQQKNLAIFSLYTFRLWSKHYYEIQPTLSAKGLNKTNKIHPQKFFLRQVSHEQYQ